MHTRSETPTQQKTTMRSHTLLFLPAYVAAHGAMITPAPRSSHDQVLDDRNKCGSQDPYSKAGFSPGEYCGLGCLGELNGSIRLHEWACVSKHDSEFHGLTLVGAEHLGSTVQVC